MGCSRECPVRYTTRETTQSRPWPDTTGFVRDPCLFGSDPASARLQDTNPASDKALRPLAHMRKQEGDARSLRWAFSECIPMGCLGSSAIGSRHFRPPLLSSGLHAPAARSSERRPILPEAPCSVKAKRLRGLILHPGMRPRRLTATRNGRARRPAKTTSASLKVRLSQECACSSARCQLTRPRSRATMGQVKIRVRRLTAGGVIVSAAALAPAHEGRGEGTVRAGRFLKPLACGQRGTILNWPGTGETLSCTRHRRRGRRSH